MNTLLTFLLMLGGTPPNADDPILWCYERTETVGWICYEEDAPTGVRPVYVGLASTVQAALDTASGI